jgi:Ni/Fe-hydrogenase 1 B-type cytochrome subunit
MLEIRYVWEWPVRLTHWINFISIVVLSVTGFYIGNPFMQGTNSSSYVMGWMRFCHFVFAYLFALSVLARLIWGFFGNRYASWREFFPWVSKRGWKNIRGTFNYYTFLKAKLPHVVGHNALAAMAYSAVFLLFIVQIFSGFALYGQSRPDGAWGAMTGWLLAIFGNQGLRLTHHLIMWLLVGFVIHHVYSAWLMDAKEKNGTLSSIFGGYKFVESDDR